MWDGTRERIYDDSPSDYMTFIRVNGSDYELNPGDNFVSAVKSVARQSRMGKFRLYLDGSEVDPDTAPSTIEEGMKLEIRPYDEAGQ